MNLEDIEFEMSTLNEIRNERRLVRKHLFKFLRENVHVLPNNSFIKGKILRKMEYNWLGDFSDKKLIEYSDIIYRRMKT